MEKKKSSKLSLRVIHRYLGFFLAGIMTVYSISGIVLIFRDSEIFEVEKKITKQIEANVESSKLGKLLKIRKLKVVKEDDDKVYFEEGFYDINSGVAEYTVIELPIVLKKMTHFHKAKSEDPLFFFNIFFGLSLLFFAISSFWMYMPKTTIFKKGLFFMIGGIVFTLVLLFI